MKEFYVLAKKDIISKSPHDPEWPKIIGYSYSDRTLFIMAGEGHGLTGFEISDSEAGNIEWGDLFAEIGASWIPGLLKNNLFLNHEDLIEKAKEFAGDMEKIQA